MQRGGRDEAHRPWQQSVLHERQQHELADDAGERQLQVNSVLGDGMARATALK